MPDSTNWPGGWYVYEDGRVSGPLAAEDAFRLQADAPSGKPRMVSRKGFSQWYALKDLSEIFRLTEEMGRKARDETLAKPAHQTPAEAQSPAVKARSVGKPLVPPQKSIQIPPPTTVLTEQPTVEQTDVSATETTSHSGPQNTAPQSADETPHSTTEGVDKNTKAPTTKADSVVTPNAKSVGQDTPTKENEPEPPLSQKSFTAQAALMQEYLIQRGRLKLGKLKNPWMIGFVGLPATLGVFWFLWIRELTREIKEHCNASSKKKITVTMPNLYWSVVPGVHVYMTWRLAKLIASMEAQNRYQAVSPITAAWLSLFPPFALVYLQNVVNNHWLLHVRHSMTTSTKTLSQNG